MSLIIFVLILSLLILVHEWGHFITARKCGVKVEQFALGFGPKLCGWVHEGTEFCLCAIPLGGFVKMAGDEREKCSGTQDEYFSQSAGKRALIVLMGPVVNLILAYACFCVVFMVGYVDMDLSSQKAPALIGQVLEHSPAAEAGLKLGDQVVSINHQSVAHWSDLQDFITRSTANVLTLGVERQGHLIQVRVVPQQNNQQDIFGRQHRGRRIGIGPLGIHNAADIIVTRYGFFESFGKAAEELTKITVKTYEALYEMAIGARSPKEAMGIVGMFFVIKFALTIGFSFVLHIIGVISASLAIFNLLPLVPLDGGHLFLIGLEKIRGKALSMATDQRIAQAGFVVMILMAVFVFYSDFERIGLIDRLREVLHV